MPQDKNSRTENPNGPDSGPSLREAIREARIEAAERTGVVVDLRDAEIARLELLNEEINPVFSDIPANVELFDRGISRGDIPRLWINSIAHIEMGRDKRVYRFVQDTRFGRRVLAESAVSRDIANAVTRYVAHRLIDRDRALAGTELGRNPSRGRWQRSGGSLGGFVIGVLVGAAALAAAAWLAASHSFGP